MESYKVSANGVTLVCYNKDNVLEWIEWIVDRGMVPTIERQTA